MKRKWLRRSHLLAIGLSLLLCSGAAWGAGAKVLFVAQRSTAFSARVRAEIAAMGLELVDTDQLDEQGRSTLSAAAYVIESPPPRRIELWLKQPHCDRLELHTVLEVAQDEASNDEPVETVRVSEQLRAFFQPFQEPAARSAEGPEPGAPVSPAVPAAPAVPAVPAAPAVPAVPALPVAVTAPSSAAGDLRDRRNLSSARFFEGFALGVPLQPGSMAAAALLRGGFWTAPRWGLGAKVVIPLLNGELRNGGNSATVSTALIGAELSLRLIEEASVTLLARAGLALLWLRASGTAQASYSAASDSGVAALPSLALQLGHPLTDRFRVCAEAELGVALPQVDVAFANHSVATFGRPWGLLSLGVQVDIQP